MNKYFYTLLSTVVFITLICGPSFGQSSLDIFRLTKTNITGTARSLGMNGTMHSIGADFTSLSSNPAGIGQYKKSEFMFSPGLSVNTVSSKLDNFPSNLNIEESKVRFVVPNVGIVFVNNKVSKKSSVAFAFGINNLSNLNSDISFEGWSKGSIVDRFAANAQGLSPGELDNYETGLAYDTYLIDETKAGSKEYFYDYENYQDEPLKKSQYITTKGGFNELLLDLGGSINNKFLYGIGLGIPLLRMTETKSYVEADEHQKVPFFDQLKFNENRTLTGSGINGKLGFIYRPFQMLNIGASFTSPTIMAMTDEFNTDLTFNYTGDQGSNSTQATSPDGTIDYSITTPMKVGFSLGSVLGKVGMINMEVEYTDFSKGKMKIKSTDQYDKETQSFINSQIKNNYQGALKANIGGELAISPKDVDFSFRLRAGYGFSTSPYESSDKNSSSFGFGAGMRYNNLFFDFGFRRIKEENTYFPYYFFGNNQTSVHQKIKSNIFLFTIGLKFN